MLYFKTCFKMKINMKYMYTSGDACLNRSWFCSGQVPQVVQGSYRFLICHKQRLQHIRGGSDRSVSLFRDLKMLVIDLGKICNFVMLLSLFLLILGVECKVTHDTVWNFSLTFGLMVIIDELLELGMLPKLKWLFLLKAFTMFIFLTHITIF
jgi:hypothetical protein